MKNWAHVTSSDELTLMIHDRKCEYCHFDYESKEMILSLSSEIGNVQDMLCVKFVNVYAYEMIACDFWAPSPHVFDCSINSGETGSLYQRIKKEVDKNKYSFSRLKMDTQCIEVQVQYSSGDVLTVLCDMVLAQ